MPPRPLFAYGTLRDPDILAAVLGRTLAIAQIHPAHAHGFIAVHYPRRVYPALISHGGGRAEGLLLAGLTTLDIRVLDAFEGAEYRRAAIDVQSAGNQARADAYLPAIAVPDDAVPWTLSDWTLRHKAHVLAGETNTAMVLRQRLFVQEPGPHD